MAAKEMAPIDDTKTSHHTTRSNVSALVMIERHQFSFSILPGAPSSGALIAASATTNHIVSIFPSPHEPGMGEAGTAPWRLAARDKPDATALWKANDRNSCP